jgi:3-oxoacyl-[acyl-carrier protein] reductase
MKLTNPFRRSGGPLPPRAGRGAKLAEGRVALVTGGAGLVGSAICRALALEGAAVAVVFHRSETRAHALVEELRAGGARAAAWRADIRSERDVTAMAGGIADALGAVDVLVNNAAPSPPAVGMRGFLEHGWDDYQTYVDTVLKGSVLCAQAVLPAMMARRFGRIINIGTASVERVNAHLNPYVTAKAGLVGLTRSLAEEFGPYGITVNQVVPGWMWAEDRAPGPGEGEIFRSLSPLHPGVAGPDDVADAVAFLASDRAAMITGAYLPVAAGQVMTPA